MMIIFTEKTNNKGVSWYILEQKEQVKQYHSIIYSFPHILYIIIKDFIVKNTKKLKEFYDEHYLSSNINILVYLLYCVSLHLSNSLSIHQSTSFFDAFQSKLHMPVLLLLLFSH